MLYVTILQDNKRQKLRQIILENKIQRIAAFLKLQLRKVVFLYAKNERMEKMRNENYNEFESTLDGLMNFIEELPQAKLKILNLERYKTMMEVAAKLTAILRENNPEGEITIDVNEKFNLGSISVELDSLTVTSPVIFAELICKSDNFEVYPLTNGNIRLDITFQRILKSVY